MVEAITGEVIVSTGLLRVSLLVIIGTLICMRSPGKEGRDNLVRHQGSDSSVILNTIQTLMKKPDVSEYISLWRVGHFT